MLAGQERMARDMPRPKSGYSRLQELFLTRAARLGLLHMQHWQHGSPPDERTTLITWAMRSTLDDCTELGIDMEARALLAPDDDR